MQFGLQHGTLAQQTNHTDLTENQSAQFGDQAKKEPNLKNENATSKGGNCVQTEGINGKTLGRELAMRVPCDV